MNKIKEKFEKLNGYSLEKLHEIMENEQDLKAELRSKELDKKNVDILEKW